MTDQPDVRQVLVHPAVWPHLELWLASRNLLLARVPVEDDLPTYAMVLAAPGDAEKVIRDAARQAARQPAATAPLAPCETTRHCATHGFCHRCAPESSKAAQYLVKAISAAEVDDARAGAVYARLAAELFAPECPQCDDTGACNGGPCAHPAAGQPDTQQQTQLTATDRAFLNWALDQAAHVMASDGAQFDNDGHASMARLRRVADEAAR